MYVARGRTVQVGPWDKPEKRGPGELVTLDADEADEAERFEQLGFVQDTPPNLPTPTGSNPAGIGLQGGERVQGPNYDGGR
jgi:hypothetical protein